MSQVISSSDAYYLSRFMAFESRQYRKIYKNKGFRSDAERFSLIDPVLDVEYNDEVVMSDAESQTGSVVGKSTFGNKAASRLFRVLLYARLVTYYILHFRYKAR